MENGQNNNNYPLVLKGNPEDWETNQVWRHFYRLACLFARSQDLERSLNCFVDVFLIRGNEIHNPDKDWLDFFRRQFTI